MNPSVPVKDQCVLVSNAVQGKAGIYFSCPLRFSPNTSTFMNHFTKNMRDFPIRVAEKESIKTTNMKLNDEIAPFTLSQLIRKRYYEQKLEYENRINRINRIKKSTSYFDLTLYE